MAWTYNPPPNWPPPPPGWTPPLTWRPDPSWGPVPPGWPLWLRTSGPAQPPYGVLVVPGPGTKLPGAGLMIAVPTLSLGVASFVPPLWAAMQRPGDLPFRHRMQRTAIAIVSMLVIGWALYGSASTEATGSPTGSAALGIVVLVTAWLFGTVVAVLVRNAGRPRTPGPTVLPGVAEGLARRRLREQYRELARTDPTLARSIGVGRPDLPRRFDDGGLVDLNHVPDRHLGRFARLTDDEVRRIVATRERLGGFSSVEEVCVFADLPDSTAEDLREIAILL